ncbi:MAG TPA: glycosyltransferase [Cyclobacteriaceae bacterium]|nr:glycosyltransferase [Cyclobacteriaceae bacterium]
MKVSNVINIVHDTTSVNLGVWKAATVGHEALAAQGVNSFLLVTSPNNPGGSSTGVEVLNVPDQGTQQAIDDVLRKRNLSPENSIVVSHGSWLAPTRIGNRLSRNGYRWVYVPQGMLEPWSMSQKMLKKKLYYFLRERPLVKRSAAIRAVSKNEQRNLERLFRRKVYLVENGVPVPSYQPKETGSLQYVFIGRLHAKKGILPLVQAWDNAMRDSSARLVICGPDEGELSRINPYLHGNIEYKGLVTGDDKISLLRSSHYFVLPSYSEGLPSAVLEGMSYGLIPVVSEGCNLPEVFSEDLGFRTGTDTTGISRALNQARNLAFDHAQSKRNHQYISDHFSDRRTGMQLLELYREL